MVTKQKTVLSNITKSIFIAKHYEVISDIKSKKGFHHLPFYKEDVRKVGDKHFRTYP